MGFWARLGLARPEVARGAQMAQPALSTARAAQDTCPRAPEPGDAFPAAPGTLGFYNVKHTHFISWILLFYFSLEPCDNNERALQMKAI